MSEIGDAFKGMKEHYQKVRHHRLETTDDTGWSKHTRYHWYRTLNGSKLDYWPSRNKFMYRGKVMVGDVEGFIRKREKGSDQTS